MTLGAEEVDTLKACINVDDKGKIFGGTAIGGRRRLLPNNFYKELKEVSGKSCTFITEK